ncbi:hypothetical protein GCM10010977_31710 [Citricoccus zhacaiensis]|uniref:DUF4935 domain-containing protein n=1 Tax=Citricoccus zhacaiensis TaxID=489142 RepID=A0ABQ2MCL4_9MICC|nr:hypothetical protein [Citricoccus zhacaiensis]GGO49556.1 hypothetical protein GCM10010977_31710 [Citricoccus zhacaiensis]
MPQIRAIVFDSNVFGKDALPNAKTISQWAAACSRHGAELWMSEIVVYELAQHAADKREKFIKSYETHRREVEKWGIQIRDQISTISVDEVYSAIEKSGAIIVPLEDGDAREALLDQVLVRAAGQRKSGVKTGAADSAWIRSVVSYNDDEPDGLIVVTGDSHALKQTCASLRVDVPQHAKNLGELQHLLDESEVASEHLFSLFATWVQDQFVNSVQGRYTDTIGEDVEMLADFGDPNWWDLPGLPDDGYETWEKQSVSVGSVESAEIIGDVEYDRWSGSLYAEIEVEFNVEEQLARQDSSGHELKYAVRSFPLRARGAVRASLDGEVIDFDGRLEDVKLLTVDYDQIDWQSI